MFYTGSANGMIPQDKPSYLYPHATTPSPVTCSIRPSYVLIADQGAAGDIYFNFTTTGSAGSPVFGGHTGASGVPLESPTNDGTFINFGSIITASIVTDKTVPGMTKLDISPTAWSASSGLQTEGSVIFVYNDGTLGSM